MGRGSGGLAYRGAEGQARSTQDLIDFLTSIGASASDPFQGPSYLAGTISPDVRDAWREAQNQGPLGPLGNILGGVAAPVGTMATAVKNAIAAAPKAAGAGIASWGLLSDPDETDAEPKRNKGKPATQEDLERDMDPLFRAVQGNPALEARYQLMKDAQRRSTAAVKGVKPDSADEVRNKAAAEAQRLNGEIVAELERLNPPKQSFEDAYPTASQNLPLVSALGGLGIGALLKGGRSVGSFAKNIPWNRAVKSAETAIDAGQPAKAFDATMRAQNFMDDATSWGTYAGKGLAEAMPPLAGAVFGAEAAAYPHQYNLRNAPADSPEYAAAEKAMGDDLWSTIGRGALMGGLGGITGAHIPMPMARPPIPETRALVSRLDDGYSDGTQKMANSMRPVTIPGPRPLPPDPPPPNPTGGGGGGPPQGGPVGGRGPQQGTQTQFDPDPPVTVERVQNPRGPAYSGASKTAAQDVWNRTLNDIPVNARSGYQPSVDDLVNDITRRLTADNLPVSATIPKRAQGTAEAFNWFRDKGLDPFDPKVRKYLVNQGGGTLSIPLMLAGAGLLDFSDPQPMRGGLLD